MALTKEARKALRGVEEIDWSALSHPYGSAEDVPQNLRDLLAAPNTDDALEAGTFFAAYFVCQQSHFGDAAPLAVPFLLRLLGARGVSRRGDIMTSLLSMLRISSDDGCAGVKSSLKHRVLAAFASESGAILKAARFLEGSGFGDAVEVLVVAFADTIAPLLPRTRTPKRVREIVAENAAGGRRTPGDRLVAWAARRQMEPSEWLLAIEEEEIPEEWDPSEGEEAEEGEEGEEGEMIAPEPPIVVDWEARHREDCASASLPAVLAGDRKALTELYVAYRMRPPLDQAIELSGPVARLALQAPGVYDGRPDSGCVVLRVSLRDSEQPNDLPMDAWIDAEGGQRWLAMLALNPHCFRSFCESCAFLMGYVARR